MTPTVGLAVVARDEEDNLPYLLASVEGAFDQIVLVDTGSEDQRLRSAPRTSEVGFDPRTGRVGVPVNRDTLPPRSCARTSPPAR
jgi:hypothetical protein